MPSKLEISPKTLLWLALILGLGWLVIRIRDILTLLFVAFIFMSALRPSVEKLEGLKLPRFVAILGVYLVVISILVMFGTLIFPPLVAQSVKLMANLPYYLRQTAPFINIDIDTIISEFAPLSQNLARVTFSVVSDIVTIFTLAVFVFYFLLEIKKLEQYLEIFVGKESARKIGGIIGLIEIRLGACVRGELTLGLIIGITSYLGLTLLGVSYALPLALVAGVLEMVPIIGPIISAIPAVLVALTISPGLALTVAALYFIIQQLENNLIVPSVMQKAVGIPPLVTLLALMVGGRLGGTVGIILAVPILLAVETVLRELNIAKND